MLSAVLKAEKGGFKTFVMEVKGKRVYSKLKYESGVHRVQRVPQTETQGRLHTSTATVAIMPEVKYIYEWIINLWYVRSSSSVFFFTILIRIVECNIIFTLQFLHHLCPHFDPSFSWVIQVFWFQL